ncbi:MAG: hypothetical protein HYZ61_03045 [Candidatus Andersenbacteria bacterium]|nr:hypothetical protein [Candidatus Andersenbacteria bacterium]
MNLVEFEGKELFKKYGIPVPKGIVVKSSVEKVSFPSPAVVKSQVPVGDRGRKGGILIAKNTKEISSAVTKIWQTSIGGYVPESLLIEELVSSIAERYVSISYDSGMRQPVLAINKQGGSGTARASLTYIDPLEGLQSYLLRQALFASGLKPSRALADIIKSLWNLFQSEHAILAEMNPLFELADGSFVAGDAKVILDDNAVRPEYRPYVQMSGDIAVLASGGGASMINLDALMRAGGRPANYVEYSGNPKSEVVRTLTKKVLSQRGLKGCWVVGGTANFTDIYETLLGFTEGLLSVKPKPKYPIVIRRDGPRQKEAFVMLKQFSEQHDFDIHLFGPEIPMSESAKVMVKLAYKRKKK